MELNATIRKYILDFYYIQKYSFWPVLNSLRLGGCLFGCLKDTQWVREVRQSASHEETSGYQLLCTTFFSCNTFSDKSHKVRKLETKHLYLGQPHSWTAHASLWYQISCFPERYKARSRHLMLHQPSLSISFPMGEQLHPDKQRGVFDRSSCELWDIQLIAATRLVLQFTGCTFSTLHSGKSNLYKAGDFDASMPRLVI